MKTKKLIDFFGILSKEEGDNLSNFYENKRKINLKRVNRRIKEF